MTVVDKTGTGSLAKCATRLAETGWTADDLRRCAQIPDDAVAAVRRLRVDLVPPSLSEGIVKYDSLLRSLVPEDPTPPRWGAAQSAEVRAFDIGLTLVAAALGTPFGWTGQQDGRLVHDIVPTRGQETLQVGASSSVPLEWHTEDSFHPDRANIILLACVRNPDGVGSLAASIRHVELSPERQAALRQPVLFIRPDDSYRSDPELSSGSDRQHVGIATIWDSASGPYLRYDPAYTEFLTDNNEVRTAYTALGEELSRRAVSIPLEPGDLLAIDNDLIAHARAPFRARYDGTDRWLKRVLVHVDRHRAPEERHESKFGQQLLVGPRVPNEKDATEVKLS